MTEALYDALKHDERGNESLGLMTSYAWRDDPKRLGFTLARYKFVAKMLSGKKHVLEVGCADAFASRIVAQHVGWLTVTDSDPEFIRDAQTRVLPHVNYAPHDMMRSPFPGRYSAIYALDVLEHVRLGDEDNFIRNMAAGLGPDGVMIIGMPSIESQQYASKLSRIGHVNCKTQEDLRATMQRYFVNVFMFGMNDETLHTGFGPMCHYNIALCCGLANVR